MGERHMLNILFPVYNEEKRLKNGIIKTDDYLQKEDNIDYVLTIVDNGSTDRTEEIAQELCKSRKGRVNYIKISEKGVGAAFRAGVTENACEIVGYMDVDLATDICHIPQMYEIFQSDSTVNMVNGSRWSRESKTKGRKIYRNITSIGLVWILKIVFGMRASDAICGFKFFRQESVKLLIAEAREENGWFYIIELLLRAERQSFRIKEMAVKWQDDSKNSKVNTGKLIREYLTQIVALKKCLR